ncbi:polysaccharide deacetylase family protein [Marinisporobacter balticus]|uniref:Putative sporulation protein (Polysaccharide deacetylase family) n=1 Tax=Marinisporobacter balticus TaxID=2018667 RepID=A0A4R2L0X0_9FIRM|nr:polysaccharide deacetylase family protein [Marinisporobacter balticus]TCO79893.1 putative sporulation protein (polysaccharide deacetylase family) [Marinisporobacter balticus]
MRIYIISKKMFIIVSFILLITIIFLSFYVENSIDTFFMEELEEPIRNGDANMNKMAFTCNVDWGNEEIPKILDILEEKNIKITFFVTGRWALKNPELLKFIYSKGHEIGNHAYSHKMHSKISEKENYDQIKKTEDAIMNALGIKTKYFAPPSGDFNQTTLKVAKNLGYKTILWSVDTVDWRKGSSKEIIIARVMKKPHKGAILLMHPKPATVEALPFLIDKIKEEDIEIGRISDLL